MLCDRKENVIAVKKFDRSGWILYYVIVLPKYLNFPHSLLAKVFQASLQSMAELDKILRVQNHFSPHFLLIILIYLMHALAILCKLAFKTTHLQLSRNVSLS